MSGVRLFESFLYGITSPLILVDEDGQSVAATASGQTVFHQLRPLVESRTVGSIVDPYALIKNALQCSAPTQLAAEGGLLRIQRLAEPIGSALGVLEWLSGSGEEKLRIVQEVSQAVNSSLILEDIFEALGEVLRAHIPYQDAAIVILDDSQNGIKILVRISEDGALEISGEHNTFAGYEPIVDQILRQPTSKLYTRSDLPESFLLAESTAAALVVPLINKGVVIGLIALSTHQEQGFDRYQETLLTEVSAQLAVAVENAKFYWQTQAQASREFLINQLTMSIRQSLDIDVILGTAVTELGKVTGISRCFIRYFSGEEKAFQYLLPGTPSFTDTQALLEKNIFQLRKDQPYNPFILNDVRDCAVIFAPQTLFEENNIRSLAVIPILIRDNLVGTITLHQCDAFRVWVPEDIELLKAMAEHLGVALHQAQLFLELDQQKQALEKTLEELQQAQLYLIQSEKMAVLGQFVAGIAHEVNTPLGTVISNNTTIKKCLDKLKQATSSDPEVSKSSGTLSPQQLFETAESLISLNKLATTRIQDIVKNLRNFARLDESELKTVDLHEGIDSTILLIQSSMGNGIQLVRNYDEALPLIQCFPGLLNQVFMNLLVNAIHAIHDPENRAKRSGRVEADSIIVQTRYDSNVDLVFVSVQDTGKGIPPENMAKVFDPGFTTKGVGVGTGLGLALCYRIVEKHHGRILIDSIVNQGTTFTVEIPVHSPAIVRS